MRSCEDILRTETSSFELPRILLNAPSSTLTHSTYMSTEPTCTESSSRNAQVNPRMSTYSLDCTTSLTQPPVRDAYMTKLSPLREECRSFSPALCNWENVQPTTAQPAAEGADLSPQTHEPFIKNSAVHEECCDLPELCKRYTAQRELLDVDSPVPDAIPIQRSSTNGMSSESDATPTTVGSVTPKSIISDDEAEQAHETRSGLEYCKDAWRK